MSGLARTLGGMSAPVDIPRRAFADESCEEAIAGGFYVLAAAVFAASALEDAVTAMKALRGSRRVKKLHWNEMDHRQRQRAADEVAAIPGFHVVIVGAPVPFRRQERARSACLTRLVLELHGDGIDELMMEARTPALDARDVATVVGARYLLPKGSKFRVDHQPGADMPLFWAADIVAGAVRSSRLGRASYQESLRHCVYEVEIATGL